jgi:hypothetical protein
MLAVALAMTITGCSRGAEPSPETLAQQARNWSELKGFTAIDVAGPDDVNVTIGKTFSIRAEGDPRAIEKLEIKVSGDTLKIGRKNSTGFSWDSDKGATVRVTLPAVSALDLTGSGNLDLDRAEGKSLELELTGSGNLKIGAIQVDSLDTDLTGSGNLSLAGTATTGKFSIAGSGDIDADKLKLAKADASILGSGNIGFASDGPVSIDIMGSGDVTVKGKAQCTTNSAGSGEAHCAP